jgi:hypothetical protein
LDIYIYIYIYIGNYFVKCSLHHTVWYFVWSIKSVGKKFLSKNVMSSEMLDVKFRS